MKSIQIFNNPKFGDMRIFLDGNNNPLFIAKDLCEILGISNYRDAIMKLDGDETVSVRVDTLGGPQNMTAVTESGLYTMIIRSDKPNAKPFRDWVTKEVLPSIRKKGYYALNNISRKDLAMMILEAEEKSEKLELENQKQALTIKESRSKVLFADAVTASESSILIGELAKILKQNGIEIGQNRLFEWLREHGYLCSRGESYNQPTQKAMELELFEIKKTTINPPDGPVFVSVTTKVSPKGQIYFINKFLSAA